MQSLSEQVKAHLEGIGVHFEFEEEKSIFKLCIETKVADVNVVIYCDDEQDRLSNQAWISVFIPKEQKAAVLQAINKIHDEEFWPAYLFVDEDDGTLSAKCAMYVPESGVDRDVFWMLLSLYSHLPGR